MTIAEASILSNTTRQIKTCSTHVQIPQGLSCLTVSASQDPIHSLNCFQFLIFAAQTMAPIFNIFPEIISSSREFGQYRPPTSPMLQEKPWPQCCADIPKLLLLQGLFCPQHVPCAAPASPRDHSLPDNPTLNQRPKLLALTLTAVSFSVYTAYYSSIS